MSLFPLDGPLFYILTFNSTRYVNRIPHLPSSSIIPQTIPPYYLRFTPRPLHQQAPDLRSRVSSTTASTTNHQSDEAARRARALAEYEADRDIVKERVKREKIVREVREQKAKEAAEAAALAEANGETESHAQSNHDEEEEEEEESSEDEEDEDGSKRYARQMRRAGKGQRLGGGQVLGK